MDLGMYLHMLLSVYAVDTVFGSCPDGCKCGDNKILCQTITEFPSSIPATTTTLYIANIRIFSLKPSDFDDFAEALLMFVLKDSTMTEVLPDTFDKTKNLVALGLMGTQLQSLPNELFQNLRDVRSLTLSNNKILNFNPALFSTLVALEDLDLSQNILTSIPGEAFNLLTNLQQINLEKNYIRSLSKQSFQGLGELKILRLNANDIKELPAGCFNDLGNLEQLSLQDNQIEHLPCHLFSKQQKLKKLYLSSNCLALLPEGIFLNLPNLVQITLFENQLHSLSTGIFGPMALQELWLYDNRLTHLEDNVFSNLTQLQLLVLSRNQIRSVSAGAFSGLTELGEVSLHTNLLTSLEEGTFSGLPKLLNISLENNIIQFLPGKLFHSLPPLRQVDLHNNSLFSLSQELLDSMDTTEEVILTENPWRCDGEIRPLRDWVRRYHSKVLNASILTCLSPASLSKTKITDVSDEDMMASTPQSSSTLITTTNTWVTPTEMRRLPLTLTPKKSAPATPANTTLQKEQEQDTSGSDADGLSRDSKIIIIAFVCSAIIASVITCCICWRRNKHSSRDLHPQAKTSSVV